MAVVKNIPCIRSSLITWKDGRGCTEASDIRIPIFNRIYDDACDAGFCVISDRTGKIMVFCHSTTHEDDGEEQGWVFVCIGELDPCGHIKRIDQHIEILVIND
jgi:hypothetical protein